jgi:hypothetical protein
LPLGVFGVVAGAVGSRGESLGVLVVGVGSSAFDGVGVVDVVAGAGGGAAMSATGGDPEVAIAMTAPITAAAPTASAMKSGFLLRGFGNSRSVVAATANGSGP